MQKGWLVLSVSAVLLLTGWATAVYYSDEPAAFNVVALTQKAVQNDTPVTGAVLTNTLLHVTETLIYKPGGLLSNDVLPPFSLMDDMPAWEIGALEMVRDLALVMRTDFSRSQSQSVENPLLQQAHPKLNIDHRNWTLPAAEDEYRAAADLLRRYRNDLAKSEKPQHQFYARADNLREWLKLAEKRLGSYSQRLSASVVSERLNTDLAGDMSAHQSTETAVLLYNKTSWWRIDDEFYEARGACWALLHFLKAAEYDFQHVLQDKNALVSLQQIIKELEATQQTVWSPMLLNGSGFGLVANHSLVMANYISRANAALIDLTELLSQG